MKVSVILFWIFLSVPGRNHPRFHRHCFGVPAALRLSLKIIRLGMKADAETVVDAFGKNEHVKKVFWAVFVAMAGLVLARILGPVTVHQVVRVITEM